MVAKKRVLVVGAGSAGMSCADALANHPDKFETTLIGTSCNLRIKIEGESLTVQMPKAIVVDKPSRFRSTKSDTARIG